MDCLWLCGAAGTWKHFFFSRYQLHFTGLTEFDGREKGKGWKRRKEREREKGREGEREIERGSSTATQLANKKM